MSDAEEEKVGYGRPPKASQFKPGRSGNPKGRPRHSSNQLEVVARIMAERIPITVNGKRRFVSPMEAAIRRTLQQCLQNGKVADLTRLLAIWDKASPYDPEEAARNAKAGADEVMEKLMRIVDRNFS